MASAAHRSDKTVEVFARDEDLLVAHAMRLTVDQTAQMLQHWLLRADPDRGSGPGDGDRLNVSTTFDGATVLDGVYASDDGAVVKAAVDAEYERLWRAERASGGPTRTPAQRRAAALAELARRAVGAEPGRRLACDANVVRVVTKGASEPLDVGRASRTVSPAQRRALTLRDRGCVFPGCDRPPGWCDGHHIVHWADGGPTDLANLVLLCHHHHKAMHEGRWSMARAPDGTLTITRPDGPPLLAQRLAS